MYIWILIGFVVGAVLLQQLVNRTLVKEGFEVEERLSPEVFSYNLLQAVKGPIGRLSTQLLDMRNWRERIALATLTPVELARRQMEKV